jgi:hypothetical protein
MTAEIIHSDKEDGSRTLRFRTELPLLSILRAAVLVHMNVHIT